MVLTSPFGFSDFAPVWYVLDSGAVLRIQFECPFLSNMGVIRSILPLVIICHVVPLNQLGLSKHFPWFSSIHVPQITSTYAFLDVGCSTGACKPQYFPQSAEMYMYMKGSIHLSFFNSQFRLQKNHASFSVKNKSTSRLHICNNLWLVLFLKSYLRISSYLHSIKL